ncbi:hypothetical protein F8M41_013313 [Gigaspora margarita]|uniref:F-box domain-containing protein n=1 Tax=Gigaspora margarita TaxID=4874 RepID=A0A8H4EV38_GIGMA|nr:hypothetical protein F8M41_013313 [Gigaspora margarita]
MATDTIKPYLVTDVLIKIFKILNTRNLLSALLVNREWSQVAVPMYWRASFSYKKKRSILALKIYNLFIDQKNNPNYSSQTTIQNLPTLYDYPLFLKELNYTNLLELDKEIKNINAIFKMLTSRGALLLVSPKSYLDINLYDNCIVRVEELLNYLNELFFAQKRLPNIRLVFPNGPGKMLINILKSQLESFKHLEFAKWNFNDCDWKWLKNVQT